MTNDPNRPTVVRTPPDEAQAAMLVAALDEHGVRAWAVGGFTSGFRAEVPGGVQVLVRWCDVESAREALREIEEGSAEDQPST